MRAGQVQLQSVEARLVCLSDEHFPVLLGVASHDGPDEHSVGGKSLLMSLAPLTQ